MKKLDIHKGVSIAANLGVIGGLVFLGLELNQNNEQLSSQARYNSLQIQLAAASALVSDGELSDLVAKALDGGMLTSGETLRLRQLMIVVLNAWEYEFAEYEDGRLAFDELKVDSKRSDYDQIFGLAPDLWSSYRVGAAPAFVAFMEEQILHGQ